MLWCVVGVGVVGVGEHGRKIVVQALSALQALHTEQLLWSRGRAVAGAGVWPAGFWLEGGGPKDDRAVGLLAQGLFAEFLSAFPALPQRVCVVAKSCKTRLD